MDVWSFHYICYVVTSQIANIKSFVSDNKPFFKHSMDIFYDKHFYRALRNTDTRNNWCPRCVPCLQRGIVPYEIIWWVKYKLTIKVHMRGYEFSWCILILDDTLLWCPITHVDCAMQQGHSVKLGQICVHTAHVASHAAFYCILELSRIQMPSK